MDLAAEGVARFYESRDTVPDLNDRETIKKVLAAAVCGIYGKNRDELPISDLT